MQPDKKEELKTLVLIAIGLLIEFSLIQSMMRSKTLTVMVVVGMIFFAGFIYFLFNIA